MFQMGSGGEEASSESVLSDSSFDERGPGRRFVYLCFVFGIYICICICIVNIYVSSFDERRTGSKTAGSSSGVSSDLSDSDNDYKVKISLSVDITNATQDQGPLIKYIPIFKPGGQ